MSKLNKKRYSKYVLLPAIVLLLTIPLPYFLVDTETRRLDELARNAAHDSFVNLGDGMVHYQLQGPADSRTVVFIHGGSLNSYRVWDHVIERFPTNSLQILRYDLYGHGASDRPETVYDLNLFDRQLDQLLSVLKITGQVDLAGFSLGSIIAARYAGQRPERVRTLTVVAPPGLIPDPSLIRKTLAYPIIGEYLFKLFIRSLVKYHYGGEARGASKYAQYALGEEIETIEFKGTRRAWLSLLRHVPLRDTKDIYRQVGASGIPLMAICGGDDQVAPVAIADDLKKLSPGLEFHGIDGATHGLVIDNAIDVARLISNFLNRGR